jgi:hypothetical protein
MAARKPGRHLHRARSAAVCARSARGKSGPELLGRRRHLLSIRCEAILEKAGVGSRGRKRLRRCLPVQAATSEVSSTARSGWRLAQLRYVHPSHPSNALALPLPPPRLLGIGMQRRNGLGSFRSPRSFSLSDLQTSRNDSSD